MIFSESERSHIQTPPVGAGGRRIPIPVEAEAGLTLEPSSRKKKESFPALVR